ncbi:NADPH-dependent FMN reductase [Pannus brasiliensis CCIBt3594]|uniref:NADPH-dependent FMN reductase n=1 Tax=Pannus brasiliensis CCIBt3594 TaxID=1427578 RepID=A0AAW9QUL2_9CHRO
MANILSIAGNPTDPSRTYGLVQYVNGLLEKEGFHTDTIAVRDFSPEELIHGRYDSPDLEPIKALLEQADGVIVATPIYKAAYTGLLKAFLDLLPQRAFEGKVVLPIATGGTIAHLLAIDYALKPVLSELKARHILGGVYAVDKQLPFKPGGELQPDGEIEERVRGAVRDLIAAVNLHRSASAEKSASPALV